MLINSRQCLFCCRYSVDPGDIDIPVGCVVRAMPGSVDREMVRVDIVDQSTRVFHLADHEELVSHIVSVQYRDPDNPPKVCLHTPPLVLLLQKILMKSNKLHVTVILPIHVSLFVFPALSAPVSVLTTLQPQKRAN